MPRAFRMNFDPKGRRWRKMVKGQLLEVYCHQLSLPESDWTKEASYQAANKWLEATLAKQAGAVAAAHPHAKTLAMLTERADYAKRHGLEDELPKIEATKQTVAKAKAGESPIERSTMTFDALLHQFNAGLIDLGLNPMEDPTAPKHDKQDDPIWRDRLKRDKPTPKNRTLGHFENLWISEKADEARRKLRSADNVDSLRRHIRKFVEFVGSTSPVESIDRHQWKRWYLELASMVATRNTTGTGGVSADTADKVFIISRSFINWLCEEEVLAAKPSNLNKKTFRFEKGERTPPTFKQEEIKLLLAKSQGVHRLIILLMLNCGMTQKDIADLRRDQIDLAKGRITRIRSKMQHKKAGVMVSYKLWPITLELLKRYMATEGDLALTTKSGAPWVFTKLVEGGKIRRSDNVATVFNTLKTKCGIEGADKSLKVFRKTSATRIKSNKEFRELRFLFLGHKASTVADKHYSGDDDTTLDSAIDWLGKQYPLP